MASVTTTKVIYAHELSEQLGGVHVETDGLAFVEGIEAVIRADVEQPALEAAVENYTA